MNDLRDDLLADFSVGKAVDCTVFDGFLNFKRCKYYAGKLKAINHECVQVVEHKTGILGVFYQGELFTLARVVGL